MIYSCSSEREAQRLCDWCNENKLHPSNVEHDREVISFEVRPFRFAHVNGVSTNCTPVAWGIWPRWIYKDRPELKCKFGGPFTPLSDILLRNLTLEERENEL